MPKARHIDHIIAKSLLSSLLAGVLAACGGEPAPQAAQDDTAAAPAETPPATTSPAPAPAPAPGVDAAAPAAGAPAAAPRPLPKGEPVRVTPELAAEGKKLYFSAGCNACHGGTGGGGMCPPLINDTWVYGEDDDVLRALISEGTQGMTSYGLTRVGHENVVGQMPPFASVLKEGDVDKLIAFIHSIRKGGSDKGTGAK
jgi:mono/diheme cytochrome c family protein